MAKFIYPIVAGAMFMMLATGHIDLAREIDPGLIGFSIEIAYIRIIDALSVDGL